MTLSSENINLHTHSFYCGHGVGEISDYVKAAEECGKLKVLGFSEHCPVPEDDLPDRMKIGVFDSYLSDIDNAQQHTSIRLLKGVECDWRSTLIDFYSSLSEKTDYRIGAVHYIVDHGRYRYVGRVEDITPFVEEYVDRYTKMLSSGLFLYGCHPDLFLYSMEWNSLAKDASKAILETAKRCNIPLEINGQGARKQVTDKSGVTRMPYPVDNFWKMALEYNIPICCSSDAHEPCFVYEQRCFDYAKRMGINFVKWELNDGKLQWKV